VVQVKQWSTRFLIVCAALCVSECVSSPTCHAQSEANEPEPTSTTPVKSSSSAIPLDSFKANVDYITYLKNQLKLQQTQLEMTRMVMERTRAKADLEIYEDLAKGNIVTRERLLLARKAFEDMDFSVQVQQLKMQQLSIEILEEASSITVLEAKKFRTKDEKRMVSVTLINDSNAARVCHTCKDLTPEKAQSLMTLSDVRVSLRKGAIVAEPYENIIESLGRGEKAVLSFQLLKDIEEVTIEIRFGQRQVVQEVFLKKEASDELPSITAAQFSQEGSLGQKVLFGLELEKLCEKEESYRLAALNVPNQITFSFIDPSNKAKLTQVKFSETVSKQQLQIEVSIPEKLEAALIDNTTAFYVFITNTAGFKQISELRQKNRDAPIEDKDIQAIPGNRVRLELIPRGVGEMEIVIGNKYQEIQVGEDAVCRIDLFNTGTLALSNAKLKVDVPYMWREQIDPVLIPEIKPGNKQPVSLTVKLPANVGTGEYEIRVIAEAENGNEKVKAQDKTISIRIGSKTNVIGNAVLIGGLILLVIGIAIATIRISRR
jgi:hypothetical protein